MDIATLGLKIDASGAIQGVGEVDAKLKALESRAAAVGGVLRKAFLAGGAAVAGLSALIIKNTAEMDKATAQLDAVLKSTKGAAGLTRDALQDAAAQFQRFSTYGDDAVMSAQALLLTFTNIKGDQFNAATQAILDMATAMGGDLKGATIQVGKALNDPVLGVSALAKAGVQLTESQKALVEQMVAVGDVAGAQKIILGELSTQFGGSAKAARDTMGGALAALKNAFGDLVEVPGIISPIVAALNVLTDTLSSGDTKKSISEFTRDLITNLSQLAGTFLELVRLAAGGIGGIAAAFGKLSPNDSPLNKLARGLEAVELAAFGSQKLIYNLMVSVANADKTSNTAVGGTKSLSQGIGAVGEAAEGTVGKLTELENAYAFIAKLDKESNAAAAQRDRVPLAGMALPESALVAFAEPPVEAVSAWDKFWAQVETWGAESGQRISDSLQNVFGNIVTRGKASFSDLFSFLSGAGVGGASGGVVLGFVGTMAEALLGGSARAKAAREAFNREVESISDAIDAFAQSFSGAMGAFRSELQRLADTYADLSERTSDLLTVTARRALDAAGGDVDKAIANLSAKNVGGVNNVAISQLIAYREQTDKLTESYKAGVEAAKAAQEQRRAAAKEDNEVRRLRAMGQNDEADRLAMEIRFRREIADARREELDLVSLAAAQAAEWAAFIADGIKRQQDAERTRQNTIKSLEADILSAQGDAKGADAIRRQIERDQIMVEVTDELIRAKYEELWALQDAARAAQEVADAMALLENQTTIAEDYEVRRLTAMGKTTEAEELRFRLGQERELRQAKKDLLLGNITQELYDTLVEILGIEATSFGQRNMVEAASPLASGASDTNRQTGGTIGAFASAQVQDIDRVVGELTTIRIRMGQLVQYMARFTRGGGVVGAVNGSLQRDTEYQQIVNGNIILS